MSQMRKKQPSQVHNARCSATDGPTHHIQRRGLKFIRDLEKKLGEFLVSFYT